MKKIEVSIIIVCMNNLDNLIPCLDSVIEQTHKTTYDIYVVAYLFTKKNLLLIKEKYPQVIIIESNEILGFSENNNLALRQAKGEYCLVLNDDTEILDFAIDKLVQTFEKVSENVAIVSPVLLNVDGTVQVCGRPPLNWINFTLSLLHLWNEKRSEFVNKTGVFQTYNIIGAAFLIKKDVFEKVGWFNEYYFFTPEDIALSTLLNKEGYQCYVNTDASIIHKEGMSGKATSIIKTATEPAAYKGLIHWFANGNILFYNFLATIFSIIFFAMFLLRKGRWIYGHKKHNEYILYKASINVVMSLFSHKTPKEIFLKYYNKINRHQ